MTLLATLTVLEEGNSFIYLFYCITVTYVIYLLLSFFCLKKVPKVSRRLFEYNELQAFPDLDVFDLCVATSLLVKNNSHGEGLSRRSYFFFFLFFFCLTEKPVDEQFFQ